MIDVETIFDSDREEYEFMQERKEKPMKEQNREITEIERMAIDIDKLFYEAEIKQTLPKKHPSIVKAEALYNAGYRKQSENTVELPCNVGAMIYLPWEFDGVKSIAFLTVTHIIFDREHNYVKTDFDTDDEAYYDKYQCGRYEFEDFGKIVFLTMDEAKKALMKMKGGAE